jgi:hypothetical protein
VPADGLNQTEGATIAAKLDPRRLDHGNIVAHPKAVREEATKLSRQSAIETNSSSHVLVIEASGKASGNILP